MAVADKTSNAEDGRNKFLSEQENCFAGRGAEQCKTNESQDHANAERFAVFGSLCARLSYRWLRGRNHAREISRNRNLDAVSEGRIEFANKQTMRSQLSSTWRTALQVLFNALRQIFSNSPST